jgi:hypothetical protein
VWPGPHTRWSAPTPTAATSWTASAHPPYVLRHVSPASLATTLAPGDQGHHERARVGPIVAAVRAHGGQVVLTVKANQPTLAHPGSNISPRSSLTRVQVAQTTDRQLSQRSHS